jgi:hypothetical protein
MDIVERRLLPLHVKLDCLISTLYERLKERMVE